MTPSLAALLVGIVQAAYIYLVYALGLGDSRVSYGVAIFVWLGLPAMVAAYPYWRISGRIPGLEPKTLRRVAYSVSCMCTATFVGMFLALNAFGS